MENEVRDQARRLEERVLSEHDDLRRGDVRVHAQMNDDGTVDQLTAELTPSTDQEDIHGE